MKVADLAKNGGILTEIELLCIFRSISVSLDIWGSAELMATPLQYTGIIGYLGYLLCECVEI